MPRKAGAGTPSSSSSTGLFAELKGGIEDIRNELGLGNQVVHGGTNGYEVETVCMPCLSMLQGESRPSFSQSHRVAAPLIGGSHSSASPDAPVLAS